MQQGKNKRKIGYEYERIAAEFLKEKGCYKSLPFIKKHTDSKSTIMLKARFEILN